MAELLTKNIKLKQKFRFRSNTILHCVVFEVDPRPGFEGWLSARVRQRHALPRELVRDQDLLRRNAELVQGLAAGWLFSVVMRFHNSVTRLTH